jgi:hypothetical protein
MLIDTRSLPARPAHPLDLHGAAAWTLARFGAASLWLATEMQERHSAATARIALGDAQRPRARVGPEDRLRRDHPAPESWRVR